MRFDSEKYYYENEDRYWEEREEAFKAHMIDMVAGFMNATDVEDMTSENFAEYLEDFSFPEIDEWMTSEFESMVSGYGDYLYDQMRDERIIDERIVKSEIGI